MGWGSTTTVSGEYRAGVRAAGGGGSSALLTIVLIITAVLVNLQHSLTFYGYSCLVFCEVHATKFRDIQHCPEIRAGSPWMLFQI